MNPEVVIYTSSHCPFCASAKRLLAARGVSQYREISIDGSTQTRDEMVALTGRRTVPQIYINRQHVGGFDDLATLDRSGGLLPLMEKTP